MAMALPDGITTTGPWGGQLGNSFDDGYEAVGIRKLGISANNVYVVKLNIEYVCSDGQNKVVSHGGTGGTAHEHTLDYPNEVVTSLFGYYGYNADFAPPHIGILNFGFTTFNSATSKEKTLGPYGCDKPAEGSTYFSSEKGPKIVGFFGHTGTLVDLLGAYENRNK